VFPRPCDSFAQPNELLPPGGIGTQGHVLGTYERPLDSSEPVVRLDERSVRTMW
jgi:hypothetical protein